MSYIKRYIENGVLEDLKDKMVFISGPRQAGKTTLARHISRQLAKNTYMNWDVAEHRENIIRENFPSGKGLLNLDEIHKFKNWRQVVKGLYDSRKHELQIIVTGSGKLDYYRHGGDSLQGRYHFYRLYPLTLCETETPNQNCLEKLLRVGGFPEPYCLNSERQSRRWSREYRTRIINDDLRNLENVKDVSLLEHLAIRLPDLVGSPLSVNSLRLNLQVAHETVQRWLNILENVYMIFRIYPFGAPKIRAVKKEAKHYHFDWTLIRDDGIRFENFMACCLLKYCHYQQDYEGKNIELRFFRDVDRREVDFVLMEDEKPTHFIECKLQSKSTTLALNYLKQRFPQAQALQIALHAQDDTTDRKGIRMMPAVSFLNEMGI